ncbi:hypothetical protein [Streptomyces sp. NPDC127066]|uniref:hypothetical protein n=1 Tax=Streptomyces sp. NPDC127066 TaxID=3347125 RepID=UPI0036699871
MGELAGAVQESVWLDSVVDDLAEGQPPSVCVVVLAVDVGPAAVPGDYGGLGLDDAQA